MSEDNGNSKAWEDWQLSALVLGELDEPLASEIKAEARRDPELLAELSEIKQALRKIRRVFRQESTEVTAEGQQGLRLEKILVDAAVANSTGNLALDAAESDGGVAVRVGTSAGSSQSEIDGERILSHRRHPRLMWVGLAAMAASLFLVAFLMFPGATRWKYRPSMLSQKQTVELVELAAKPSASSETPNGQRSQRQEQIEESDPGNVPELLESISTSSLAQIEGKGGNGGGGYGGGGYGGGGYGGGGYGGGGYGGADDSPTPAPGGIGMGMGGYGGAGYGAEQGTETGGAYGGYGGGGTYGEESEKEMPSMGTGGGYGSSSGGMGYGGMGGPGAGSEIGLEPGAGGYGGYEQTYRANGDQFAPIYENRFLSVDEHQLSTFSIDVDTASYAKSRQLLLENRRLPPAAAVRIEEFVSYFDYEYNGPQGDDPIGVNLAIAGCPWRPEHKLVRIALQAEELDVRDRAKANIVFLLDVSGSMDEPNKLPLVKESMRLLTEQLGENDRIAMVVYAGAAGCVLEGTRGDQQQQILAAIDRLNAGGSTNGGQGIQLAYDLARDNFVPGGINRVILCTDGDFNVGVTSTQALVELVEENSKSRIFLTVLGFGMGNTNDAMMEQISNRGNGVYGFVDSRREAHRQMVKQLAANLVTVAKDVKLQVEFNPQRVESYRLLGYENRLMAAEHFNDDTKDGGEIGAGHRVTAFYEIVPAGSEHEAKDELIDDLRYGKSNSRKSEDRRRADHGFSTEWLAVKLRYKQPEGDISEKKVFPLERDSVAFEEADRDFRWAASMVEFGMLLRNSRYRGSSNWSNFLERSTSAAGVNPTADRQECLEMIRAAANLSR